MKISRIRLSPFQDHPFLLSNHNLERHLFCGLKLAEVVYRLYHAAGTQVGCMYLWILALENTMTYE